MTDEQRAIRERDADFVQQARELSNHYYQLGEPDDKRQHLTYWLAKGHKSVARFHKKRIAGKGVAS